MTQARRSPPLAAWAIAGIVAGVTGIALLLAPPASRLPKQASMNLQRLAGPARGARVVALGTSKMMYALSFDSVFAAQIAATPPVIFTRMTWLGARTEDMLEPLELLQRAPPSVLLLEAELLMSDHRGPSGLLLATEHMRFTLLRWLPRPSPETVGDQNNLRDNQGGEKFSALGECHWLQDAQHQREYAERGVDRVVAGAAETARYFEVLQVLERAGTRVILLDVPRAPWAQASLPSSFRDAYQARSRWLKAQPTVQWWSPPTGLLSNADYCDAGHFTAAGRLHFERWLAARLADYLAASHG